MIEIENSPFVVAGDWDATPTPEGKKRIIMPPPGHVQGCGWEAFTQAGLRAVAQYVKPGSSFHELGAGTAILSVAAKLMGATKVYATELNPEALAAAHRVVAANGGGVRVVKGTFISDAVDVTVVAVGGDFGEKNLPKIRGRLVIVVHDEDNSIEIIAGGHS